MIAYKDYCCPASDIVAWSGWNEDLEAFTEKLRPTGGGDFPEAAKSALAKALEVVDDDNSERETLLLWYADAPPHHPFMTATGNARAEIRALPEGSTDWIKLCLSAREKRARVFSFVPERLGNEHSSFYTLLATLTGGLPISSTFTTSTEISRLTLDVILQWMGQNITGQSAPSRNGVLISAYKKSPLEANPPLSDEAKGSRRYLPSVLGDNDTYIVDVNVTKFELSQVPMGPLASSPPNLGKKFANKADEAFRQQVYTSLAAVISSNVLALTYNPVFGQLWRAVCKESDNENKLELVNAFSVQVGKITNQTQQANQTQKGEMQQWLEDSFDATEEIEGIISQASTGGPVVYLDLDADIELTRIELLEVSRSCYPAILKKIATIFTHLKVRSPFVTIQLSLLIISLLV